MNSIEKDLSDAMELVSTINVIGVIDHGGRAGSNFCQCLFDTHPNIVTCPIVHYVYSYWVSLFGEREFISSVEWLVFVMNSSYFKYLYNEPVNESSDFIARLGGDAAVAVNRKHFRLMIESYFEKNQEVKRGSFIAFLYAAYAVISGKKLSDIKYFLVIDAVSLRNENVFDGYKGLVIDKMQEDFLDAKIILLVRDPRAQIASIRHELVNIYENNYKITPRTFFGQFVRLVTDKISIENGPAHLIAYLYHAAAARAVFSRCIGINSKIMILKNEDINLNFLPIMDALCNKLEVDTDPYWFHENYIPTMLGVTWRGTGAYSNSYQRSVNGPLKNDSNELAKKSVGPNKIVRERWKKRLQPWEIELIERLYQEELTFLGYDMFYNQEKRSDLLCLLRTAWLPTNGEFPFPLWILNGYKEGGGVILKRLFYTLVFPLLYFTARYKLYRYVLSNKLFTRIVAPEINKDYILCPSNPSD